jgi:hypothetical protein
MVVGQNAKPIINMAEIQNITNSMIEKLVKKLGFASAK